MICISILAHDNEDVLINQIENIKKHLPNSHIVLFNGGHDKEFGKKAGIPICPKSKILSKGYQADVLIDVFSWLEEIEMNYEFLVYMDSDCMFVRSGFEKFLEEQMKEYDCMGVYMHMQKERNERPWWEPGVEMWNKWHIWKNFFKTEYFIGTVNPMQIYRRKIIKKILEKVNIHELKLLIHENKIYALEELIYGTLSVREGGKFREYPHECIKYFRVGNYLSLNEANSACLDENIYFVHPIDRNLDDPARTFISCQ